MKLFKSKFRLREKSEISRGIHTYSVQKYYVVERKVLLWWIPLKSFTRNSKSLAESYLNACIELYSK